MLLGSRRGPVGFDDAERGVDELCVEVTLNHFTLRALGT